MTPTTVERDERTTAIENAGYRWSYLVLSFGLLLIVAIRSLRLGQATWDLLALVLVGGGVNALYQALHRTIYKRWIMLSVVTMLAAALLAAAIVALRP